MTSPADSPSDPQPVRAVAKVGVERAEPGPVRIAPRTARQRIGALRIEQIVATEVIVLGLLVLAGRPIWQIVTGGALALAVLAAVYVSRGGYWWAGYLHRLLRYRRRRAVPPDDAAEPTVGALRELVPGLAVRTGEQRGRRVGIAHDSHGWYAVAEVTAAPGLADPGYGEIPLGPLARALCEEGFPVSAVQLVLHTVPAATADEAPCVRSYQDLLGTVSDRPVGHQVHWLVVRVDADDAMEIAQARGGGERGLDRALAAALARVTTAVETPTRVLDGDDLTDALARSCGVVGVGDPTTARRTVEEWERWRGDGLAHACFWISHWPPIEEGRSRLLSDLVTSCGAETSLSVSLRRPPLGPDDTVDLRCLVRVVAEPERLRPAADRVAAYAEGLGLRLDLLAGEQAPGVYASAPTGMPRAAGVPR